MNRIKELRLSAGLTQEQLAEKIGTDKTMISRLENGARKLTQDWIMAIARALEFSPADLLVDLGIPEHQPRLPKKTAQNSTGVSIPEIDVRAGLGLGGEALLDHRLSDDGSTTLTDAVRGVWQLPCAYLRSEFHSSENNLAIIEVQGDSMTPTLQSGDRVMVDLRMRIPTPPSIFALWDGLGVVCKRVMHIQGSDPRRLRIDSENDQRSAYERTLEEVHIIGRVVWLARRL